MTMLSKWFEFSSKVSGFYHCDGFAAIHTCSSSEYACPGILEQGWLYYPPHFFLEIKDDGQVVDATKTARESEARVTSLSEEELTEEIRNEVEEKEYPVFIVECRAGLVGTDSELKVRTGFWTRIIATDLEVALSKTFELWEAEQSLTHEEQLKLDNEWEAQHVNDYKGAMAKMRNNSSIDPLVDQIGFVSEVKKKDFTEGFTNRQTWWIAKFISELEEDIQEVKSKFGGRLVNKELTSFIQDMKNNKDKLRQERSSGQVTSIAMEDVFDEMRRDSDLIEEFLKAWNP